MKNPDASHFTRIEKHAGSIYQMYLKTLRDIARLMHSVPINNSKPFNFNDYPEIKHRVDAYIQSLTKSVKLQIENGISSEWLQANIKNDEKLNTILKGSRLSEAQKKVYYSRNQIGLKAFIQRKTDGLNLSDRVWLYTNQYKNEIEMAVDVAISEKVSAQNLSQTVRQYLQQPDTLFRRVRDKNGVLQLSKKAANYHPGQGVYRSSYKNAMRLARTEINMAYRTADHVRMNQLPFISGFEVKLSNNHPVKDICDRLKGKYPKEFVFKGWHPQCRCHVISIEISDEEYDKLEDKLLAGEEISGYKSPNSVVAPPDGFSRWIEDNKDRAKGWKSQPYFIKDNFSGGTLDGEMFVSNIIPKKRKKTSTEKAAIQNKWDARKLHNEMVINSGKSIVHNANEFPEINTTALKQYIDLKDIKAIEFEAKNIEKQVLQVSTEEAQLSTLLDNVKALKVQHGVEATKDLYKAVEKKLSTWESLPIEQQKKKLLFEIQWIEDNKKYETWKGAQDAYKKRLEVVNYLVEKENVKASIDNSLQFALKSKSKPVKDMAAELQEMLDHNKPISQLQYGANKLNEKVNDLIAKQAKSNLKKRASVSSFEDSEFPDISENELNKLLSRFETESVQVADRRLRGNTEALWKDLDDWERNILTKYTQTYSYLNEPLRGLPYYGSKIPNADHVRDLPILTQALNKCKMPENTIVRRGVNNWNIDELGYGLDGLKQGDVFVDKGFLSTAVHREKGFSNSYNLVVVVPKGAQGVYAEPFSRYTGNFNFSYNNSSPSQANLWNGVSKESIGHEQEWIGQRGSQFKVLKKKGNTIYLQMIGQLK